MNQEELKQELDGDVSIAKIQQLRDPIRVHLGMSVPRRPADVEDWYERKKSVLTRKLNTEQDVDKDEDESEDDENESESE